MPYPRLTHWRFSFLWNFKDGEYFNALMTIPLTDLPHVTDVAAVLSMMMW